MEELEIEQLRCRNPTRIAALLRVFNEKNANARQCVKLLQSRQWHALWRETFAILENALLADVHTEALNTLRILSRDADNLERHDISVELRKLLGLAQLDECSTLYLEDEESNDGYACTSTAMPPLPLSSSSADDVQIEALKCLCNLLYLSNDCRRICMRNNIMDAALKRVASAIRKPTPREYYDLQLLFLLTAYDATACDQLQENFKVMTYLTKWLDEKVNAATATAGCNNDDSEQLNVMCVLLKLMCNVARTADQSPGECEIQDRQLTIVLRELLTRFYHLEQEHEFNLVTHAINLLATISGSGLSELTYKAATSAETLEAACALDTAYVFEQRNVHAVAVLLDYLRSVLRAYREKEKAALFEHVSNEELTMLREHIPPVLTVLCNCARSDKVMRHYLRREILPQPSAFSDELRTQLCGFLATPCGVLSELATRLLFVLCKENVGRMMKYTGYGNAHGLLGPQLSSAAAASYSPDEDDSANEAAQLANLIEQLQRFGDDSKPQPLEQNKSSPNSGRHKPTRDA